MLSPGTGESSLPRMGLLLDAADVAPALPAGAGVDSVGSPGSGGSSCCCGAGAGAALGEGDLATLVDDGALGCGAHGSAAARPSDATAGGGSAGGRSASPLCAWVLCLPPLARAPP